MGGFLGYSRVRLHSKSSIWSCGYYLSFQIFRHDWFACRYHMRSFSYSILVLLRCNAHRQSSSQNAYSGRRDFFNLKFNAMYEKRKEDVNVKKWEGGIILKRIICFRFHLLFFGHNNQNYAFLALIAFSRCGSWFWPSTNTIWNGLWILSMRFPW